MARRPFVAASFIAALAGGTLLGVVGGGLGILLDVESTPAGDLERAKAESIPLATSLGDAVDKFFALLPA